MAKDYNIIYISGITSGSSEDDIDGKPMHDDDDLDGKPLSPDDCDVDGLPMDTEQKKGFSLSMVYKLYTPLHLLQFCFFFA